MRYSFLVLLLCVITLLLSCVAVESDPVDSTVTLVLPHAGDDGQLGIVELYEIRVTDDVSTLWSTWDLLPVSVTPREVLDVNNVPADTFDVSYTFPYDGRYYYFCAKAQDDAGLWSVFCILDSVFVPDNTPPGDVAIEVLNVEFH